MSAAAVFALAVAGLIAPLFGGTTRDVPAPSPSAMAGHGGTLAVGGLAYRSTSLEFKKEVQWGQTSGSIERAVGLWVIVRVDVTNTTTQFQRIPWLRVTLRDGERTHRLNDSLSRLLSRASGQGSIDDLISPGATLTTLLVFDVPTTRDLALDVQGALLELD